MLWLDLDEDLRLIVAVDESLVPAYQEHFRPETESRLQERRKSETTPRSLMSEFAFHPDAVQDLEEIWEYIPADS